MGHRSTYTEAAAAEIVERLSKGEPLADICRSDHMPAVRTVSHWRKAHPDFNTAFLEARDDGFDEIAADTLRIIDTVPERTETKYGDQVDAGFVAWQKNRVEQRLKLLAKWDPRRYGEKQQVEHSGEMAITTLADRMRRRRGGAEGVEDLV